MWAQFLELSFAAKMLSIVGPTIFVVALWFSLAKREFTWPNIAVMALGICCPILPSIQKLSVGKDSLTIEQFAVVSTSKDALEGLQKAAQTNSDAIGALSNRMDALTAITNLIAPSTPANASVKSDLTTISEEAQKIGRQVKSNNQTLDDVRSKTDTLNRLLIQQAPQRVQ